MYLPDHPIPLGETLKEILEVLDMNQKELAEKMGCPVETIREIIEEKRAISDEMAIKLVKIFGITSKFWSNLEANYQKAKLNKRSE